MSDYKGSLLNAMSGACFAWPGITMLLTINDMNAFQFIVAMSMITLSCVPLREMFGD